MNNPYPNLIAPDRLAVLRRPVHIYELVHLGSDGEFRLGSMSIGMRRGSKRVYRSVMINRTLAELPYPDRVHHFQFWRRYWARRGWLVQDVTRWSEQWSLIVVHPDWERHL